MSGLDSFFVSALTLLHSMFVKDGKIIFSLFKILNFLESISVLVLELVLGCFIV